eukprot:472964-Amphidinium_carterae.2
MSGTTCQQHTEGVLDWATLKAWSVCVCVCVCAPKAAGADSGFEKLVDTLARSATWLRSICVQRVCTGFVTGSPSAACATRYWKAGSAEETLLWAQRWFRNRIDEAELSLQ